MIQTGSTLGDYEILGPLGKGGMGEVWRARDTKLGREVAIKLLPETLGLDPERLARFEREARVLASLNHAHIATLFGFHTESPSGPVAAADDGSPDSHDPTLISDSPRPAPAPSGAAQPSSALPQVPFLVMELVEGETLEERIGRGKVPVEEAARLAVQIAEALEAAHDKGVVHRDLKPANVKVGRDGGVKVLDFGLAKAVAGDAMSGGSVDSLSMSPTLTQAMTGQGVLLGTAGYMSPEQARAQPVDRRTDVWAFGCLLYEMLTAQRAFGGDTVTDVLGAIVHKEPELERLPPATPDRLKRLLERCLRKDSDRRLQSIGDARIALEEWLENPEEAPPETAASVRPSRLVWLATAAAALLGLVVGALLFSSPEPTPEPVRRFTQQLSEDFLFNGRGGSVVLSPDGESLAYVTVRDDVTLNFRPMHSFEAEEMVSDRGLNIPTQPFFSPDGEWLGFLTRRELKKMRTTGGSQITLAELDGSTRGAGWGPDDRIVVSAGGTLSLVPAAGGTVEPLTSAEGEAQFHEYPQWLPGGRSILFSAFQPGGGEQLEVVDVATGERKVIHESGYFARYVDTGHVLFVQDASLFALPFDAKGLEATGSPMPLLEGISSQTQTGAAQYDVSQDGLLVYVPGNDAFQPYPVLWTDRHGASESLWDEPGVYGSPRLSPDGKRVALCVLRGDDWDVWVYDTERDVGTRLTFGRLYDADAVWSPDGRDIAYTSETEEGVYGIFRKRADGSGEASTLLASGELYFPSPLSWSSDGSRLLLVTTPFGGGPAELWFLAADGSGEVEPFLQDQFPMQGGAFSPDGRFVAYRSNETGRPEIFVQPVEGGGKWQISDSVGAQPRWSPKGDELFYRTPEGLVSVSVEIEGDEFRAGRPRLLFGGVFETPFGINVPGYSFYDYDVGPDGERFVIFARGQERAGEGLTVNFVTGWFEELKGLTASGR
jgi:serine/threonine-protein kinase